MVEFTSAFMEVPRFGHSRDFSVLFGDSPSQKTDYTLGTIFIGSFLFTFFIAWLVLLTIFLCQGPKKAGYLAGFQMKQPWGKEKYRTPTVVRSIFVFSCIVVIVGTVLLTTSVGLSDLKSANDASKDIISSISQTAIDGNTLVKNTISQLDDFQNLRDDMVNQLRESTFCPFVDLSDNSTFSDDIIAVDNFRNDLAQDLWSLEDFGKANFMEFQTSGLEEMEKDAGSLESIINTVGVKSWHLWLFSVIMIAIPFFMMTGAILAWIGQPRHSLSAINTWLHLPIFLVFVAILWIIISLFSVGLVMTADFCSAGMPGGDPDSTMRKIVNLLQDDYLEGFYMHWIPQNGMCEPSDFPLPFLTKIAENLENTTISIASLLNAMDAATNLNSLCNTNFVVLRDYLTLMSDDYTKLTNNVTDVMDMLSCDAVHPLYVDFVHITCKDVPESGVWAFSLLLLISTFSMLMITFRTAWLATIRADTILQYGPNEPQNLGQNIEKTPQDISGSRDSNDGDDYGSGRIIKPEQDQNFDDPGENEKLVARQIDDKEVSYDDHSGLPEQDQNSDDPGENEKMVERQIDDEEVSSDDHSGLSEALFDRTKEDDASHEVDEKDNGKKSEEEDALSDSDSLGSNKVG